MALDWTAFVAWVAPRSRFLLVTHVRSDGDGLGAMLALSEALRYQGKHVRSLIPSPLLSRYRFLDPHGELELFQSPGDAYRDADAVIVLDTGTWNQLGDFGPFLRSLPIAKAVIDHHVTQDDLGAVRFVDTSAEATGRLAHEAIVALGVPLSVSMAERLFTALVHDTGWFRHASTSTATFELAAELRRAGVRPERIYEDLFERASLPRWKLTSRALDRLQTTPDGRVAWTEITLADFALTGASPSDTEELVNYSRSIEGVEIGLILIEQPDGRVKVSLRSRTADVRAVAEELGGGGHRLAAGATVNGPLAVARDRVLQRATETIRGISGVC